MNNDFLRDCENAQWESSVSTDVPMLVRLEPYGLTVLTGEDMEQFASEVTRLARGRPVEYLEPLLALAQRCAATPGSELRIEGD